MQHYLNLNTKKIFFCILNIFCTSNLNNVAYNAKYISVQKLLF